MQLRILITILAEESHVEPLTENKRLASIKARFGQAFSMQYMPQEL
jgi:hypothetical protein